MSNKMVLDLNNYKEIELMVKEIGKKKCLTNFTKKFVSEYDKLIRGNKNLNKNYEMMIDDIKLNISTVGWLNSVKISLPEKESCITLKNMNFKDSNKLMKPMYIFIHNNYKTKF